MLGGLKEVEDFELERFFAEHEFSVEKLLCCSDCESMSIKELLDLPLDADAPASGSGADPIEALLSTKLGYTESDGDPSLRDRIASRSTECSRDDVLVFAGASEGILAAVTAVLGLAGGDGAPPPTVIVQAPGYQSLHAIARGAGARVLLWGPAEGCADALRWDVGGLEALLDGDGAGACLVVANSPHNPSGHHFDRREQERIVRGAAARGARVLFDEVYRGLEPGEAERLPLACDVDPRAISLGVMSKSLGLPGLRLGWIVTRDADVLDGCRKIHDYTTICTAAPSEQLSIAALDRSAALLERSNAIVSSNLDRLDAFFAARTHLFRWRRPRAGPIAFPALIGVDAASFCERLRVEAGVLLLPGSLLGELGDPARFRIGFGRKDLPDALDRLAAFVDKNFPKEE